MSKVSVPSPKKKLGAREKDTSKLTQSVHQWLSTKLGKEVKSQADLQSGVVACELLNKIRPKCVTSFDAAPKTVFAKAENYKKFNAVLTKCGICPLDLPTPMDAANGKSTAKLYGLLHRLSTRATSLKYAPEHIVRKQAEKAKAHKAEIKLTKDKKARATRMRVLGAIRAANYQRFYRRIREHNIKRHIKAEKKGNFFVPSEPKIAFVMRIRGINGVPPKPKKILKLFRLRQIHNAVFVRINKATLNMLKVIEPYIAMGYPSVRSIRCLLLKRGYACINRQRIPITTNALISKYLGKYGVHTMDDMVFQLFTAGSRFAKVNRFLWPFKMNSPRGGYGKGKLRHFVEGGAHGNRMGMVNRLIRQCL